MRQLPACVEADEAQASSRARRRRRSLGCRDERGFMLIFVLATILFVSLIGLAVMSYTATSGRIAVSLTGTSASLRAVDAALELGVNNIRSAPIPSGGSCVSQTTNYTDTQLNEGFTVQCSDGATPNDDRRIIDLIVTKSGGGITLGQARIKIIDKVFGTSVAGYAVEVCDWQLGIDVAPTLGACSA